MSRLNRKFLKQWSAPFQEFPPPSASTSASCLNHCKESKLVVRQQNAVNPSPNGILDYWLINYPHGLGFMVTTPELKWAVWFAQAVCHMVHRKTPRGASTHLHSFPVSCVLKASDSSIGLVLAIYECGEQFPIVARFSHTNGLKCDQRVNGTPRTQPLLKLRRPSIPPNLTTKNPVLKRKTGKTSKHIGMRSRPYLAVRPPVGPNVALKETLAATTDRERNTGPPKREEYDGTTETTPVTAWTCTGYQYHYTPTGEKNMPDALLLCDR
nr:hypothetical protein Iba_chr14bCG14190 [Ipomoea batatas]